MARSTEAGVALAGLTMGATDETRQRGRRFHTVTCQKLIRTYQFGELRVN